MTSTISMLCVCLCVCVNIQIVVFFIKHFVRFLCFHSFLALICGKSIAGHFIIAIKMSKHNHLYTDSSFVALAIIPILSGVFACLPLSLCVVILPFWTYKFAGLSMFLLMKYVRRKQLPENGKKRNSNNGSLFACIVKYKVCACMCVYDVHKNISG